MTTWPRLQLSLQMYLVMMLGFCIGLGWLTAPVLQLQARAKAYRELQPKITREKKLDERDWRRSVAARIATVEQPFQIKDLWLKGATDEDCARLALFPELQRLTLLSSQTTPAGLNQLAGLNNLVALAVVSPKLTDEWAKTLPRWPSLEHLNVGFTPCGDQVIEAALAMPKCVSVIGGTTSTDRGLELLLIKSDYELIELHGDQITGAPLLTVPPRPFLQFLWLPRAQLTSSAQLALRRFPELRSVLIPQTKLEPQIVTILPTCLVDLGGNIRHWSEDEIAKLKEVIPRFRVHSNCLIYSTLPGEPRFTGEKWFEPARFPHDFQSPPHIWPLPPE